MNTNGNLYVVNYGGGTIMKYSSGVWTSITDDGSLNNPFGIAVDINDNLYVTNSGNNTIMKHSFEKVNNITLSDLLNQYGNIIK